MKSPFTGKEMKLLKELAMFPFRKQEFQIMYHYYKCEDSGEEFTNAQLDRINQAQVYNQYRQMFGIPFPEEIRAIREKYKISASKMSVILGFGVNTYRHYEAGEMPSVANGRLILAIKQPEEFMKQVTASFHILPEKEVAKYLKVATSIEQGEADLWDRMFEKRIFANETPSEFTGFKTPDFEKIAQVIAFLGKQTELYKTKLNKLLFYADFHYYQLTGFAMTGISYRAIQRGPVPAEYDKLYLKLCDDGKIEFLEVHFDNGVVGELIKPTHDFDDTLFSQEEINVLRMIIKRFGSMNTKKIVDISHEEKAWIENHEEKRLISYQRFAFHLNDDLIDSPQELVNR